MLTEDQLHDFEQKLNEEKKKLEQELDSFADKQAEGDYKTRYQDFGDEEDDNAEEYRQHEIQLSLEKKLEPALKDVTDALARIDTGTYGTCEVCGEAIKTERLEAYPSARFCMAHADK
ncbi:MAG: TraR/DksA family transcriptional regulator [Patescibacteria group bacterium]